MLEIQLTIHRMDEYMKSDLEQYKFMEGDGYWEDDSEQETHTAATGLDAGVE